jgi:hypothetical protein
MDYSKGKIYLIRSKKDDNLIYVGSTIEKYLSTRFTKHKTHKGCSLYEYINNPINNTDWNDWYIELYEEYSCENKLQLCKRENEVIREKAIINKIGYGTKETKKEYQKEYQKEYREINNEYQKEWRKNKEDIKEYDTKKTKEYRQKNNEKTKCSCGSYIVKYNLTRHEKSKKHLDFLNM